MKSKYYTTKWETKVKEACKKEEKSMARACSSLGMNKNTFISHAKRLEVYKPNQSGKGTHKKFPEKISTIDIIDKGLHPQFQSSKLRKRLIEEEIKEEKCERCGNKFWEEQVIPLELHHLDGNHHNHIRSNLRLLCPNCHALTNNYGSKNHKV